MTRGTLFLIKRGKGAEGVESVGSFCLLSSNVILDFSHVKGGERGSDECKLVFGGGGVSGVHGISLRTSGRHGSDKSGLSSHGLSVYESRWHNPSLLFCTFRVYCLGKGSPVPPLERCSIRSGHRPPWLLFQKGGGRGREPSAGIGPWAPRASCVD